MLTVRVNDRWDLAVPDHRVGHWERNPTWEPERLASMAANLQPGMVVYDLGAEHGDLSALFASWVTAETKATGRPEDLRPRGGVILVEPGAHYWPTIRATFEANGLCPPLAGLVGYCGDDRRFAANLHGRNLGDDWPPEAFAEMTGREAFLYVGEHPEMPCVRVDDLVSIAVPDAITMDVEGAEILVARGMQRTLAEHRPLVWVSVHAELMFRDHGVYQTKFFSEFHRHGYEKAPLGFDHELHMFLWPAERRDEVVRP